MRDRHIGRSARRDRRGEIANQLIYHALHLRLLAEGLAEAAGTAFEPSTLGEPDIPPAIEGEWSWLFDVALDDLRDVVVPNVRDEFAARRAKGLARLLKFLREVDHRGPATDDAEQHDLDVLVGESSLDLADARRRACEALRRGRLDERAVLHCCLRQVRRLTELMRPAMGALADRHYSPIED